MIIWDDSFEPTVTLPPALIVPQDIAARGDAGTEGVVFADHSHRGVAFLTVGDENARGEIELLAGTGIDISLDAEDREITVALDSGDYYSQTEVDALFDAFSVGDLADVVLGSPPLPNDLLQYRASPGEWFNIQPYWLELAGGTMTGDIDMDGNGIIGADVVEADEVWVDTLHAVTGSPSGHIDVNADLDTAGSLILAEQGTAPASVGANKMAIYAEDIKGFTFISSLDDTGMRRKYQRDSVFVAKNTTGSSIPASRAVYAIGSEDDVPLIAKARANSVNTMPAIGVTLDAIADGAYGRIMQMGLAENVNTSAFSAGDVLYVSSVTAGILVATAPLYPNLRQEIGTILAVDASLGSVQVVARSMFNDGIIDHGGLLGLADNDHTQYLLLAGGTMTGDIDMDGSGLVGADVVEADEVWVDTLHAVTGSPYGDIDVDANLFMGAHGLGNNASVLTFAAGAGGDATFGGGASFGDTVNLNGNDIYTVNDLYLESGSNPSLVITSDTTSIIGMLRFLDAGSNDNWSLRMLGTDHATQANDLYLTFTAVEWLRADVSASAWVFGQDIFLGANGIGNDNPILTFAAGANGATTATGNVVVGSAYKYIAGTTEIQEVVAGQTVKIGTEAEIGQWPADATYAMFGNADLDHSVAGNYAVLQQNDGDTFINAATGKTLYLRNNHLGKMEIAGSLISVYEAMRMDTTEPLEFRADTQAIWSSAAGYLERKATTAHRWQIGTTEKLVLDATGLLVDDQVIVGYSDTDYPVAQMAVEEAAVAAPAIGIAMVARSNSNTIGQAVGYGFIHHSTIVMNAAIAAERTDTGGRCDLHLCVNQASDGSTVDLNDKLLSLTHDGEIQVYSTTPLQFRDPQIYIASDADGIGALHADSYWRVGSGTTSHALAADGNFLVSGILEVDGTGWFDGTLAVQHATKTVLGFYEGATLAAALETEHTFDQMVLRLEAPCGTQLILSTTDAAIDHDHANGPPTLYIHDATSPTVTNNKWGSLHHDSTGFVLTSGANIGAGSSPATIDNYIMFSPQGTETARLDTNGLVMASGMDIWTDALYVDTIESATSSPEEPITFESPIVFGANATNWEDLRAPATAINPPGQASDPDWDNTNGGWLFDPDSTEVLWIILQVEHAYMEGSTIYPHVHWQPTDAGGGNVLWRIEYKWTNTDATDAGGFTSVDLLTPADGTALKHQQDFFTPQSGAGKTISSIISVKLSRIGGDGTDTYGADALLKEFDIHIERDSIGSKDELTK